MQKFVPVSCSQHPALTVASNISVLLPPAAVENQAADRIHRLGQHKPIHVTRFIIGGSIEERILKLQVCQWPVYALSLALDIAVDAEACLHIFCSVASTCAEFFVGVWLRAPLTVPAGEEAANL